MTVARTTGETVSERVFHHNQHELYRRVRESVAQTVPPEHPDFPIIVRVRFEDAKGAQ